MSADNLFLWKSYFYPGTEVLINKGNYRDKESLKTFEYESVTRRQTTMPPEIRKGNFDLKHLQAVHGYLFQDVYEWAGQLRDVRMSKGKSGGFERPENFEAAANALQAKLVASNYLKGRNRVNFVDGLTSHHCELNRLHPFREGNGRSTRAQLGALCSQAGYLLDRKRIENDKGQWNKACAAARAGDKKELKQFFMEAVRPARSVVFEHFTQDRALARFPELKPVYEKLAVVAERLAKEYPDKPEAQAHFMLQKRTEAIRQLDSGENKGLAMPEAAKPLTRSEAVPAKAQEYANTSLKDPAAKALFMSEIRANLAAMDKAPAAPAPKKPEPDRGR